MSKLTHIKFYVGEKEHSVSVQDVTPETSLNKYLREILHLTGTKRMCLEGGCGTCIVVAEDKSSGKIFAINSCLVSIFSCHGWMIHTIEGIKESSNEPHPISKVLAEFNGSQCGFCSPGMVMNMYALYQNGDLSMEKIEDSFGGNICRCTGYRPILSAFKSLAHDCDYELIGKYPDIEDLHIKPPCREKKACQKVCKRNQFVKPNTLTFESAKSRWVKVYSLTDVFETLKTSQNSNYILIAGNTAQGVYRPVVTPELYIDVSEVVELNAVTVLNNSVTFGGNVTLNHVISVLNTVASENPSFAYFTKVTSHINLVANVPVRNIGTLAGNLMIKHAHPEFPSDIYLLLTTMGAVLRIVDDNEAEADVSLEDFLHVDMLNKVIKYITLFALDPNYYKFESYKIMPRYQNVHALVNAGFLLKLSNGAVQSANIIFGNINPQFIHATQTEQSLIGKQLFDNDTLRHACDVLNSELHPNDEPPEPSSEFRKQLAISLFYKFILSIAPDSLVSEKNKSGRSLLVAERPISSGTQDFYTNKAEYPLTQPITRLTALQQTTGKAMYIIDEGDLPNQLFASLVTVKATAGSTITRIDATKALSYPGVEGFFGREDIPGRNTFTPFATDQLVAVEEEIFCSGNVLYYDQPVGVIVATSQELADKAAEMVEISFRQGPTPLLTIQDVLKAKATNKIKTFRTITAKRTGNDVFKTIKGKYEMGEQFQFHMELQDVNVIPVEDTLIVHAGTQWMHLTQTAISSALNIPCSKIEVRVRRIGGAFGAKLTRNSLLSTATALAAVKLQKPVKMWMTIEKNMDVIGKRDPLYSEYEVSVNSSGAIQSMTITTYTDYGTGGNDFSTPFILDLLTGNYNSDTWNINMFTVNTDSAGTSWTRAPGSVTGLALIESIMDHIAYEIGKNRTDVRLANMDQANKPQVISIFNNCRTWADFDNREKDIEDFNTKNRWKKRGISLAPMAFNISVPFAFSTLISIFRGDGTVTVIHGGTEIGQGINTKAAQVCAFKLGIPLDLVAVMPSSDLVTPNSGPTGGSVTSESICSAVIQACDKLLERMKPYRASNPTWLDMIRAMSNDQVELFATGAYNKNPPIPQINYVVYGACVSEVEVDLLTGQNLLRRVDLFEDTGESTSPLIDVGQVEGAFIMGLGLFTTEKIIKGADGRVLTDRTWTYWPPGAKDIPVDFRVRFDSKPNPGGVLNSKAVGEPPMCLSCTIPLAIRQAVASARTDSDDKADKWFPFNGPTSVEDTFLNSLNNYNQYIL